MSIADIKEAFSIHNEATRLERIRCLAVVRELRRRATKLGDPGPALDILQDAEDFISDPSTVWRDEEASDAPPREEG